MTLNNQHELALRALDVPYERWVVGLEDALGAPPVPTPLFIEAFTHPSYANEQSEPRPPHNQRLEFLGDAVIGLAVAEQLWSRFPDRSEGDLARARTALVNTETLAELGRTLQLGRWLLIGKGEEKAGGRERDSLLCDALEAVVGALFVGHGWEVARQFIVNALEQQFQHVMAAKTPGLDAKTRLQELLHERGPDSPIYDVTSQSGPDHARVFTVTVSWQGEPLGSGEGRSKRAAEQVAASNALRSLALRSLDESI